MGQVPEIKLMMMMML